MHSDVHISMKEGLTIGGMETQMKRDGSRSNQNNDCGYCLWKENGQISISLWGFFPKNEWPLPLLKETNTDNFCVEICSFIDATEEVVYPLSVVPQMQAKSGKVLPERN